MSERNLLSRNITRSPAGLLRLLHRIAALSVVLILTVSAWGIHHVFESYVVQQAEADAVSIKDLIMSQKQPLLDAEGHDLARISELSEHSRSRLDAMLRQFLLPFDILKIKIYDPDGTIIYSTEQSDVGQVVTDSPRLTAALAGRADTRMQTKDEIHDLQLRTRHQVDVVETYVPVYNSENRIIGSFELYRDISASREEILTGVLTAVGVLAAILALVFSLAFLVVRMAISQLSDIQRELHRIATRDDLTGLLNRREVMNRAEQEFARHQRAAARGGRLSLSIIMADVDHFKQVNDHFGHPAGDQVLREIASVLNQELRCYNATGRYGGEEFLILLSETGNEEAVQVAERLRTTVRSMRFGSDNSKLAVTLSLGVATTCQQDREFDQLLKRADRALYQAKESGRDRVITDSAPTQLALSEATS